MIAKSILNTCLLESVKAYKITEKEILGTANNQWLIDVHRVLG